MKIPEKKGLVLFDLTPLLLGRLPEKLSRQLPVDIDRVLLTSKDQQYYELLKGVGWDDVSALVIFGHRLPDLVLSVVASFNGVQIYYVQHGLFKERLERSAASLMRLVALKAGYYWKSFVFARRGSGGSLGIRDLTDICISAFYSNRRIKYLLMRNGVEICTAYLFDEKQFVEFRAIFGQALRRTVAVGVPDAGRIESLPPKSRSAVIICQSLVEDGRLSEAHYRQRLAENLSKLEADGWNVDLFMHQRADLSIYKRMGLGDKVIENKWLVPSAELYLTDYSSLILEPLREGRAVSRLDLSGHEPMQEVKQIALYPTVASGVACVTGDSPFKIISEDLIHHAFGWCE